MNFKKILVTEKNRKDVNTFFDCNCTFAYWDQYKSRKEPKDKS